MGDEHEILSYGSLWTPPDVEGALEGGENHARLLAPDREALDRIPFDVESTLRLRRGGAAPHFSAPLLHGRPRHWSD